jgi:protein MpaA
MNFDFRGHRVHDYPYLLKRWKSMARRWGLQGQIFATGDDFELICFRSPALKSTGGIYLSAGIHGDEPASTEGLYHDDLPRIQAQKELLRGFTFRLAMCLHEDYDAQGVYLYEIRKKLTTFGQELLSAAGYYIPVDARRMIEGRRAQQGWIARRVNPKSFPILAEGIYVALNHSERTITAETPSEYDLGKRIEAQIAMIQRAIELSFV